jgi:hypothetical protein
MLKSFTGIQRHQPDISRRGRGTVPLPVAHPTNGGLQYVTSTSACNCSPSTLDHILTTSAYENGTSALLLTLSGTLPVTFRGATYGFPVAIWVPYAYPREPPIVYITPSQDMVVRPGQHVSGDGRVYHPYLAQWAQYWDVCMLCAEQHVCWRIPYNAFRS